MLHPLKTAFWAKLYSVFQSTVAYVLYLTRSVPKRPALSREQAATNIQKVWKGFKQRKLLSIEDLTWMYRHGVALRNQSYTAGLKEREDGGYGDAYSLAFLQLAPECALNKPWLPGMKKGVTFSTFAEHNKAEQALLEAYYAAYIQREQERESLHLHFPEQYSKGQSSLSKAEYQSQVLFGKRWNMLFVNSWQQPEIPPEATHAALRHRMHSVLSHLIWQSLYIFKKDEHNIFHIMTRGQDAQTSYDRDDRQYPTGKCGSQGFYRSQILASVCQNPTAHNIGLWEYETPDSVKRRNREVRDVYYKVITAIKKARLRIYTLTEVESSAVKPVVMVPAPMPTKPTQGWFSGYFAQVRQLVQLATQPVQPSKKEEKRVLLTH